MTFGMSSLIISNFCNALLASKYANISFFKSCASPPLCAVSACQRPDFHSSNFNKTIISLKYSMSYYAPMLSGSNILLCAIYNFIIFTMVSRSLSSVGTNLNMVQ